VVISDITVLLCGSSQTHLGTSMPSGAGTSSEPIPGQPRTYEGRIRAVLEGQDALAPVILPLLVIRTEAKRRR